MAKNAFYLLDLMWLEGKIHLFPISSPYLFKSCDQELHSRVDYENVWTILSLTELLSISTISSFCENFILWNFKETLKDPGFTSVSSDILIKLLSNKCLNVLSESTVIDAIRETVQEYPARFIKVVFGNRAYIHPLFTF